MTSILNINHYIDQVNNFIHEVETANNSYYVYAAKPSPWLDQSGNVDESAVKAPNTSVSQVELDTFNEMVFGKQITAADVIHMVPRHDWVANTVYAQYDANDPLLYTKNFFVVTTGVNDEYSVYKCIDNNKGANSTIKPNLVASQGTFRTGDGYIWKYMYTIDVSSNTKFTTASYIPVVANAAVQGNAIGGTIDAIRISNGGTGYSVYETGFAQQVMDTNSIKLSATASSLDNYYTRSSIYLKSGFGAGQVREISAYNGTSKIATLANSIDTYTRLDLVNTSFISGGGAVGETVTQEVDSISYISSTGYFNPNSSIVQSDSTVAAAILAANSTVLQVSKVNKSLDFSASLPFRSTSDSGIITSNTTHNKVNVSNSTGLSIGLVLTNGSGYTGNTTVTIAGPTGSFGATANATANSTGKITAINVSNSGTGYTTIPTVTVSAPTAQTFNANTAVTGGTGAGSNNVIALNTAASFVTGDRIIYSVSPGNTVIGGLSNNTTYFVQFANNTVVALSATANTDPLNRIALTKGLTETGHSLQGITATGLIYPANYLVSNAGSNATSFATDYPIGSYIRVGENANTNFRRVESVNSTVIVVNQGIANTILAANAYKLSTAALPSSIVTAVASGVVSNTNLDSLRISIANTSVNSSLFIIGERVEYVTSANVSLNANGIVSFSNTSSIFITGVSGTWNPNNRVRGLSSSLTADITAITQNPNVTLKNPSGTFTIGYPVDFKNPGGSNTGLATVYDVINLSSSLLEYEIGPTVKIEGDGSGAVAIATVDTSNGTGNAVSKVAVIYPGMNYTEANVTIYANTSFGSGATALAVVSPILGHGSDPIHELGARYAGIDVKFNTTQNESWYYPTDVSYRKVGVIKNPAFANVLISVTDFDRAALTLSNTSGSWVNGEIVVQNTSNAAGIVAFGNSTYLQVRNVKGTFVPANTIYGYTSGANANVTAASLVRFSLGETVEQVNGGVGKVSLVVSNNQYHLTNVIGKFVNGAVIYSNNSNAYATVNSISSYDGSRDLTTSFGLRFNQTARVTLTSNTGAFSEYEFVTQANTAARGMVVSGTSDLDLAIANVSGSFATGDTLVNANTSANAKITFANSTYIRLTGVSNSAAFSVNNSINNGLGANAQVSNVYSVLILSDVSKANNFSASAINTITGSNSGSTGIIRGVINPDLIRESGRVTYMESSNTVVDRSLNTTEEIRLVVKF